MSQNYLIRIDEPERPFTELAEVPRQKERQLQLVEEPMFSCPPFGVSFRQICSTVTSCYSVLNVRTVRLSKFRADSIPAPKSTVYTPAAKARQQKKL